MHFKSVIPAQPGISKNRPTGPWLSPGCGSALLRSTPILNLFSGALQGGSDQGGGEAFRLYAGCREVGLDVVDEGKGTIHTLQLARGHVGISACSCGPIATGHGETVACPPVSRACCHENSRRGASCTAAGTNQARIWAPRSQIMHKLLLDLGPLPHEYFAGSD